MQPPSSNFWHLTYGCCLPSYCVSPSTDGLCSVVPHASSVIQLTPSTWFSHWLAHASGLQWPASLGTPPTDDHMYGVSAHPGQPSTPNGAYSQAAGLLRGLPLGATCAIAWYAPFSSTQLPLPYHQGVGYYSSSRASP